MTPKNNLATDHVRAGSLIKRVLVGAGIALVLIIIFLFPFDYAKPEWGKFWMIRPLIVVPLAGAAGGLFYHLMEPMRSQGGWKKAVAIILCVIVYIVGLWLGAVLGLDGTMWD